MTQEEILLKVGLDGSNFDSNLSKAEGHLTTFAEHGHQSFVHVERPARAFHHLLGEIGQRVPLVAEALEALVNPTTGIIALVGAGFGLAMEKIKEFGKNLDEISAKNARAIELNKEGLAEMAREQKEFSKSLNIDPVTGITKAVSEEKDPVTRLSQSRQNRERFAAEMKSREAELKRVREQERRLTQLPDLIKATQEVIETIEAAPQEDISKLARPGVGLDQILRESKEAKEARLSSLRSRAGGFRAELGANRLKEVSARRAELEAQIRERSRAIDELTNIIEPLAPHDVLPRGRRAGSFNISGPGGSFSGTVGGTDQDVKNYLKQIAESPWVKDGKISVPNGK